MYTVMRYCMRNVFFERKGEASDAYAFERNGYWKLLPHELVANFHWLSHSSSFYFGKHFSIFGVMMKLSSKFPAHSVVKSRVV